MLSKLIEEQQKEFAKNNIDDGTGFVMHREDVNALIATSMELAYEAGRKAERGKICAFAIKSIQARFKAGKEAGMSHEALETFVIESFVLPKDNKETVLSEDTPPQPSPSEDLAV
ncbi:hypothetical protein A2Z56_02540 [Candidatus Kaiserbacteria bacterium RIFCSPHIGHO2_12_45_16]|nr:MAG: hypothetical protein A2Z56_02540 [Candidatus Kaiserbacteria bacterium RIFCSPHIGHO2_12_45_16]